MTADDWLNLNAGTPIRIKTRGANGATNYHNTTMKRRAYYVQGKLWITPVDHPAVRVRDVEVIPQPEAAYG